MPISVPTPLTALEEGVVVTTRSKMNFVGEAITVTDDSVNDRIRVSVGTPGNMPRITVSAIAPVGPSVNDLWVDIS